MAVLNFTSTRRKAFADGFVKGLTAPANLYRIEQAPAIPDVMVVSSNIASVQDALSRDWSAVAGDMRKAVDQHGKNTKVSEKRSSKHG